MVVVFFYYLNCNFYFWNIPIACDGIHPSDRAVTWESKENLKNRIQKVIEKYKRYPCVIFVFHQTAMQAILGNNKIEPAQIVEYKQ